MINNEMVDGYLDGLDKDSPEPNENRSHSYRHGFKNGRDDLMHNPRKQASAIRSDAKDAEIKDLLS
jgi:hypothetical protein